MSFSEPRIFAIVPAGGVGARAGTGQPKQYRLLCGQPMLRLAVCALLADARIRQVRVAVAADDPHAEGALRDLPRTTCRPCGGPTRAHTVLGALHDALNDCDGALLPTDWVLVHDAARPGLPADALARLIDACLRHDLGGLLAEPVADTVKRATPQQHAGEPVRVMQSVSREALWLAQTPQMFRAGALLAALEAALADDSAAITDEASAMERAGHPPLLVAGSLLNRKVTWPEDFDIMERLLGPRA